MNRYTRELYAFRDWVAESGEGDPADAIEREMLKAWQARADIAAERESELRQTLETVADSLESSVEREHTLMEMLRIAKCPDSSNASHDAHPCPWCHEREAILATHEHNEGES